MFDPMDPLFIEACLPGAITGQADVVCPHCAASLSVSVHDPLTEEAYRCAECGGSFATNWADETVRAL